MLVSPSWQSEVNKNKHWENQASKGEHLPLPCMTKLMSQGLYLQYNASSGVYYSHGDCERPSDMAHSSNRLTRGSQVHLVECNQGVVRGTLRCVNFGLENGRNAGSTAV